jgi:cyanophycinase
MTVLPTSPAGHPGPLIALGGAEDKVRERVILRYFLETAGGPDASIVVLATASEVPETGERYSELFYSLNADSVEVLRVATREDALTASDEASDLLAVATGIFITGGSQLRLSSAIGGTGLAVAIQERHAAGVVVAGTSAGAAFLSRHMIALGDSGATPRRRLVHLAPGLGLATDVVIDQHFRRRDRLGRLLTALSYNPSLLGVGVDENTAAVFESGGRLSVIGESAVTVVDAANLTYTDCHAVRRGQPVAMLGIKLDILTAGCRYDLTARRSAAPPPGTVRLRDDEELPATALGKETATREE